MTTHTLPIYEIKVLERQRLDVGDLTELASSMEQYGLIQPIVINQERRLIAGGRRIAAAIKLGWSIITVVYRETLSDEELHILELEENLQRLDETWQEQVLHITTIHTLKVRTSALNSEVWTQKQTARLLGFGDSNSRVSTCLAMAELLKSELDTDNKPKADARFWKCDNLDQAWKLWLRDKADEYNLELHARFKPAAQELAIEEATLLSAFERVEQSPDLLDEERKQYYSNPHNLPGSFDSYWEEKKTKMEEIRNTVYLGNQLIHGDSIQFMMDNPDRFDHIITDIPYGIDLEMLNQQNQHGGFNNLDQVEELHDVEYNKQLIADFFPAAYRCTRDKAFVITWCDQMLWQYMYDLAIQAGFAVQRWPITWVKTQAMNQCPAYNTTKNTEIAIVCRKKSATIAWQPNKSTIECGKDELCGLIKHPFAKPFLVWELLTSVASVVGQTILEPFAGHGSGVISMLQTERHVVGVELDDIHYATLLENVKNLFYKKLNPNSIFK